MTKILSVKFISLKTASTRLETRLEDNNIADKVYGREQVYFKLVPVPVLMSKFHVLKDFA
jgi:hypothetical protein